MNELSKAQILSKWLLIIFIPVFIIAILGLSCWAFSRQRRRRPGVINIHNSDQKTNPITNIVDQKKTRTKTNLPRREYPSSPPHSLVTKSRSTSSSQLTRNDMAYLDKLVRTASDRSMWKRDNPTEDQYNKPRKIPSGQIQQET